MKKVVVLLTLTLFATSAFAVVDDAVNSMGIYFDMNADVYETAAPQYVAFPAYVMLTNPDFGAVYGYEFSWAITGNCTVTGVALAGTSPIDVGGGFAGFAGNHIVGLASPMPSSPATVLATISIFPFDANAVTYELKGALPNSVPGSTTPAVLLEGDVILATGLSAGLTEGGDTQVCAILNGQGVVATDDVSIDAVKALYR